MKYEDLVKMSVKELKDRLKDLNTQAQAAAGKDLDALLEEATTITGILHDVKNREKLGGIAKDAEGDRRRKRRRSKGQGQRGTRTEHQRRKGSQVFRKENLRRKERPFRKSDRNTDTQRGRCERNL